MRIAERWTVGQCHVCSAKTRPQRATPKEFPGTTKRAGTNICAPCYKRRLRGDIRATPEQKARIQQVLQDHTLKGLTNFMAARHQRQGVRP